MRVLGKRGFTLVELLIAIAIMIIMAAIAVPNFQSVMARMRLNGAARQVMTDLMAARMRAVTLNARVKVAFPTVTTGTQYTVYFDSDRNGTVAGTVQSDGTVTSPESAVTVKNIQTDYKSVTLHANNNPIFLPDGTATSLPTVTITSITGTKCVTVSIAGRVAIVTCP
jgi:type IV fimbrial biogenesis protein FimT